MPSSDAMARHKEQSNRPSNTPQEALQPSQSPDYVVLFRPSSMDADKARLENVIRALSGVGLDVDCRSGGDGAVLAFVRCPENKLYSMVRKARY